jgi:hypothetical protein
VAGDWHRRRGYKRRQNGRTVHVRGYWVFVEHASESRESSYRHFCPRCQAAIVSVHMPNGGWAHFEGAKGLGRVKHPCFTIGDRLSRRPDEETGDLFE